MTLKPFFSYEQQIEELRNKGIVIDHDEGLRFLQDVNYYRLLAFPDYCYDDCNISLQDRLGNLELLYRHRIRLQ